MDDRIFLKPFYSESCKRGLFIFPHAGSGAGQYFEVAQELAKYDINTFIFRYPGRESRINEKADSLLELAAEAAKYISEYSGRFALLGHSLGGYVAFEATRILADFGAFPCKLFLSGQKPPELIDRKYYADCLKKDDSDFIDWIQNTYQPLPAEVIKSGDIGQLLINTLRNDYQLLVDYSPDVNVFADVEAVLLNGRQDGAVSGLNPPDWGIHLKGITGSHYFSGGHFYLFKNIEAVCGIVSGYFTKEQ
ncbi:MAG: hypothetical protein C0602_06345 [Denitrovibrio sp.]|nr:MAG: hypothetical protein C0602_06345 [Denitrovibrio sp.]